jgi:hypothetical protein
VTGTGDGDVDVGETITVTGNTCGAGTTAIGASYVVTGFSGGGMPAYQYQTNGANAWTVSVISQANNQAPTLSVRTICLNT